MKDRLLYRVGEVADLIGCSKSEAYKLVASGELPSVRVGGLLRVPADALHRLISSAERKVDEEAEA
jgi:excisionase family DNA binding protein